MNLCSADGCKAVADIQITEKFLDPEDDEKVLFTQTWNWCKGHDHMDKTCQHTTKDTKNIAVERDEFLSYMPDELLKLGAKVCLGKYDEEPDLNDSKVRDFLYSVLSKNYLDVVARMRHGKYPRHVIQETIMKDHNDTSIKPRT